MTNEHFAAGHPSRDHTLSNTEGETHLPTYQCNATPTVETGYFSFNVYSFFTERETEREAGEGQRERGRHGSRSRLRAPSRQPRARRGARTLGPRDRDLAEVGRSTDCATQAPPKIEVKYQENGKFFEKGRARVWNMREHR